MSETTVLRRRRPARCRVLLLAGSSQHPSRAASRRICRDSSGRRLCRVQHALRGGSKAGTDHGSRMLGPCQTQAVRACRHRREGARQEAGRDLADRFRGRSEDGCHLHAGTLDQRLAARAARGGAPQGHRAAGERSHRLDETGAGQALAPQRSGEGHGLHAQAHRCLHPLPSRRPHLPEQQCGRARAAWDCDVLSIVHPFVKYLGTLEFDFRDWCDTGDRFARSRRRPDRPGGRRRGFGTARPAQPVQQRAHDPG